MKTFYKMGIQRRNNVSLWQIKKIIKNVLQTDEKRLSNVDKFAFSLRYL